MRTERSAANGLMKDSAQSMSSSKLAKANSGSILEH